jgi:hypothetical protein
MSSFGSNIIRNHNAFGFNVEQFYRDGGLSIRSERLLF